MDEVRRADDERPEPRTFRSNHPEARRLVYLYRTTRGGRTDGDSRFLAESHLLYESGERLRGPAGKTDADSSRPEADAHQVPDRRSRVLRSHDGFPVGEIVPR